MIKILLLEDNDIKYENINSIIKGINAEAIIDHVKHGNGARRLLENQLYDLFIFDMQVPLIIDGPIKKDTGFRILEDLNNNRKLKIPPKRVCITAFEESYEEYLKKFGKNVVTTLIKYEENASTWESQIEEIIKDIENVKIIEEDYTKKNKKVIFAIHGFNTRGNWKNNFSRVISEDFSNDFIYCPWDYGSFGYKELLLSKQKDKKIEEFHDFYNFIAHKHFDKEIYVVAHSFGSYIIGESLKRYPEVRFDKILLLGNVLERDYSWTELKKKGKVKKVKSLIGEEDFALKFSWLAKLGNAGKKGFKEKCDFLIEETYQEMNHSDMFGIENMRSNWMKFFTNN